MSEESGFQISDHAPLHYQAQVEYFMAPFVEAMVATSVKRGDAVLDAACGTGFATRAAARVVGSNGRVVGSDINAGMVAMAQSVPWAGERPVLSQCIGRPC
jgi:protein-L-isoaspartate O-methyltransferase